MTLTALVETQCDQVHKSLDDCVLEQKKTTYPYVPSHTCVSGIAFGPSGAFDVYCDDWEGHNAEPVEPEPIETTVYSLKQEAIPQLSRAAGKSAETVRAAYDLYAQISRFQHTARDKVKSVALEQIIPQVISANNWEYLGEIARTHVTEMRKLVYDLHTRLETPAFGRIQDCLKKSMPDFAMLYDKLLSAPEKYLIESPTPRRLSWDRRHSIERGLIPDSGLDELLQLDIKANYRLMLQQVPHLLRARFLGAKSLPEERASILNKLNEASKRSLLTEEYALFRKTAQVFNEEYCAAIIKKMDASSAPLAELKTSLGNKTRFPLPAYEQQKFLPKESNFKFSYEQLHRCLDVTVKLGAVAGIGAGYFLNKSGDINSKSGTMFIGMWAGMFLGSIIPRVTNGLLGIVDDHSKSAVSKSNVRLEAMQSRNAERVTEYLAEIFHSIHPIYSKFTIPRKVLS